MKYLLIPFRLVRELVGYNLCFFEVHHYAPTEREVWPEAAWRPIRTERYLRCTRCGNVKLPIERLSDEDD